MMNYKTTLDISTNVTIQTHDSKTMNVIETIKKHNIVTTVGKNLVASLLGIKAGVTGINYFAVGTSNTAVALADTTLGTEVFRNVLTDAVYTNTVVTFKFFLASTEANGNTLVEAGLFGDNATGVEDTGDLFAHVVHNPIVKNDGVAITYSWEISIS